MTANWLGAGFLASLEKFPDRPALAVDGVELSYADLAVHAAALTRAMGPAEPHEPPLTAVLAARSVGAYAGVLAALFRGHGYVPLNPNFPTKRLGYILRHTGCRTLIVDSASESVLADLVAETQEPLRIIFADRENVTELNPRFPGHDLQAGRLAGPAAIPAAPNVTSDDIAYLLYTSGSTGLPKGVMNSHGNVAHFLSAMLARHAFDETDRFSQMFDLSFDLSVCDIFLAWSVGGCVVCPAPGELMLPDGFIRDAGITVWFSVPSVAVLLNRLRKLEPGCFPGLKLSLFCGEALPIDAAEAWAATAPNAYLENLYGPTEVTIACTAYRWRGVLSKKGIETGIVPIGTALPGLSARVVDETLCEVAPGAHGELLMTGPQVALGYWREEEKTAASFVIDPASGSRAYRTGDLVRRPETASDPLLYLGRLDHQIKLHGHRIELGEIEAVLKNASGASRVIAMGWPVTPNGAEGIITFLECETADRAALKKAASESLPTYMVPKQFLSVPRFPLTANGKVDRKALLARLGDPEAANP